MGLVPLERAPFTFRGNPKLPIVYAIVGFTTGFSVTFWVF